MPWFVDPQHPQQLIILATGGALVLSTMGLGLHTKPWIRKTLTASVAVVAMVACLAYVRFGEFHTYGAKEGSHTYHYHDIFHYAMGAKFYPELEYEHLYECTWLAMHELREKGVRAPNVEVIRSLEKPDKMYRPAKFMPFTKRRCHGSFSKARWNQFRYTVRHTWLEGPWSEAQWKVILHDMGFNPPPSWSLIAHNATHAFALNEQTLEWLPLIDVGGVLFLGGGLIWWAFGWEAAAAYLLILGTNWMASYRWTGGSYFRQLWFILLVSGMAMLKTRHFALAGIAMSLSVLMRVFPAVFVVGALAALGWKAWSEPERRRDLWVFSAAGIATAVVTVLASMAQFGSQIWVEFADKMSHHGTSWFMWHIGYKKWATFDPEAAIATGMTLKHGWIWAPAKDMDAWWDAHAMLHNGVRALWSAAALAVAARREAAEGALIAGGTLLFLWLMPANYYYVYLALMPAVFYQRNSRPAAFRVALVFVAMFAVSVAPYLYPDQPYEQQGLWNRAMFWFFVALLGSFVAEPLWRGRATTES